MNSVELTRHLHRQGYLSKEAAVAVLKERDKLIKEALFVEAATFFKKAGLVGDGIRGVMAKLRRGGKTPLPAKVHDRPGWSDVGSNLTKILALAGLTSASMAGIQSLSDLRRDKKLQSEIQASYKAMKKEHPRIAEMDPTRVRSNFAVLSRYAPSLAANPTVAGAFVATNVARGSVVDPATIKTLAQAQETIDKVRGSHRSIMPFVNATGLAQSLIG